MLVTLVLPTLDPDTLSRLLWKTGGCEDVAGSLKVEKRTYIYIYTEKNSEIKVMEGRNRSVFRCVKEKGRKRQERHRKLQIGAEKWLLKMKGRSKGKEKLQNAHLPWSIDHLLVGDRLCVWAVLNSSQTSFYSRISWAWFGNTTLQCSFKFLYQNKTYTCFNLRVYSDNSPKVI